VLEEFIQKQEDSGDACSSRLLEAKRVLDGLLADVKSLSVQVDSHEEVLETETENLNITEESVKAVEIVHDEAIADCDKEKQDAIDRVSQYQSELAEMDQIAKPSVRYDHVTKVYKEGNVTKASVKTSVSTEPKETLLLQEGVWTRDACVAFLELQRKKKHRRHTGISTASQDPDNDNDNDNDNESKHDMEKCNAEREELQKAFTEAYIKVRDLLKQAEDDVEDTTCVETADATKSAKMVPLITERERAASLIESSTQSVAALDPVLDLVNARVEKISNHILNELTPECEEAKEVSEALQKIRELILTLEKCPGRNDFKLEIPTETPPAAEEEETPVANETAKELGVNDEEEKPTEPPLIRSLLATEEGENEVNNTNNDASMA